MFFYNPRESFRSEAIKIPPSFFSPYNLFKSCFQIRSVAKSFFFKFFFLFYFHNEGNNWNLYEILIIRIKFIENLDMEKIFTKIDIFHLNLKFNPSVFAVFFYGIIAKHWWNIHLRYRTIYNLNLNFPRYFFCCCFSLRS